VIPVRWGWRWLGLLVVVRASDCWGYWWLFGLGFDIKIKVESDWQAFQAYSILFLSFVIRGLFMVMAPFAFNSKYPTI